MTDTVEFGDPIPHDGSDECPEHARDVPCMIAAESEWLGDYGEIIGQEWAWQPVTHYRLPADHPFYAKGETDDKAAIKIVLKDRLTNEDILEWAQEWNKIPKMTSFSVEGEQPAEEPTCGGCRWWDRYDSDFALPDQGRCHFNPATPDGFGLCFEDSMACSKFTAKGAGQ